MLSSFFRKSNLNKKKVDDLEEKENIPFLEEIEQKKKKKDDQNSTVTNRNSKVESSLPLPKGHEKYSEDDKDKCPYFQMQKNTEEKLGEDGKPKKKEKQPKGGCPFMPSEKKKNPNLDCISEGWNEEFISPHSYQIDYRGFLSFSFDQLEKPNFNLKEKRKVFDTYPVYLKHTLFMNDENMKKVRELEVAQRFFVYDKLREKGNKEFHKGNYEESILYYERAMSCFKWLQHVEKDDSDDEDEKKTTAASSSNSSDTDKKDLNDDQNEEKKENHEVHVEMEEENAENDPLFKDLPKETPEEKKERLALLEQVKKEKKAFRKKYKGLMVTYTDDNVVLHDGEDLTDSQDIEMRQSMLMTIYMSLAVAYMKCFYFKMAQIALDDAYKITQKSSQILFRRSQAVAYNKFSTIKELEDAKKDIETAIEMKRFEKIFQQEQGILRIMNLSDHNEAYVNLAHYCVKRIKERSDFETEQITMLFKREKHIEEVEQRLISEGKIPKDHDDESSSNFIQMNEEHQEYEIILEMMRKYYRVIEFYTETKKPDQVKIAKKELQTLCETVNIMNYLLKLDFKEYKNNGIMNKLREELQVDLDNEKILRRLDRLRKDKVKDIFENGNYNFEVFQYALKDYFKKKEEKEQREKEENEQNEEEVQTGKVSPIKKLLNSIFGCEFFLQILLVATVFGLFFYINSKDNVLSNLIFTNKK
ncbi:transmembrane protein, putative (macronuclear) [Tetrahymena thermophila SB210]|uniref:Transmembrane protein, putative n=1 Tax=Tetrahymena thermophila (strain SB210) TaxID=312017 RepID=I7MMR9_TETTS|nr:transmembrane protein, putative [Tetrahymena thermophila SB210]EAS06282.3 transmembrane protein, putative [Tetrahymena thermophila SB210]|eukprot:XP_001026527.3 transmembrane protein, putative [Tetrahymena thermophila SB210]